MSSKSIFDNKTKEDVYEEIRQVYLADNRPWILGFSGGKDSTCMTQIIWKALMKLEPKKRQKPIFIISSDTLVESPKVVEQITDTLEKMEKAAKEAKLQISTNLVRPLVEDSFWVCLLGRGYPAPSNLFRWCTDRLKIRNADRFIKEKVSQYGEAIVVLGTRKEESSSRKQSMDLYEIKDSLLSRHSKFPQTYVYSPLRDFTTTDVWNYLLQNDSPWGAKNRDLLALYQNANSSDCPLVVDTTTPSCGNSRFGCWTCTVVTEDKSLKNTIENGEEWMEPLLELRQELKETQNPETRKNVRELKRRSGHMKLVDETMKSAFQEKIRDARKSDDIDEELKDTDPYSVLVPGPYTLDFCKGFLERLLTAQMKVRKTGPDPNIELITEDEIHEIQRIWRMEKGDWKNTAYQIYEKITKQQIIPPAEDLGGFGAMEQEILEKICVEQETSPVLVSKLLNTEYESQGMMRRSKVYHNINKILSEEWREDMGEIVTELTEQRKEKDLYSGKREK